MSRARGGGMPLMDITQQGEISRARRRYAADRFYTMGGDVYLQNPMAKAQYKHPFPGRKTGTSECGCSTLNATVPCANARAAAACRWLI
eukprot:8949692-Pyramimonas_sp.AAC.1